jgi:two-component system LytT family sensor kinase
MEFQHPFITNPRLAIYYGVFWLVAAAATVFMSTLVNGEDLASAMVEVFSGVITYAIIGSAIWYVIKFSTLEDHSIASVLFAHLIAASIIVFIWMYFGAVVIKLLHPNAEMWLKDKAANRIFGGYMVYVIYVVFFYAVNYYQGFREKVRNEGKLKSLVKEAELHALKSQINPHFLFNSLNSISSLTMTDPGKAQEMVINLSQLMRYSLKHEQKERVTFRQELENNKLYLSIEKVRFGSKLNPVFAIEENCLNAEIPNMILQPLYENAIKYGVYEATETVDVITHARFNRNMLEIIISNNYDDNVQSKKGEGIGLRNIRDRLQLIYGNPHFLQTKNNNNEFTVTLNIPQNIN